MLKIKASGTKAELDAFRRHNCQYITGMSKNYNTPDRDRFRRVFDLEMSRSVVKGGDGKHGKAHIEAVQSS